MTVLMRDELNEADLAWAAADPSVAHVMGQLMRARATVAGEATVGRAPERDGDAVAALAAARLAGC